MDVLILVDKQEEDDDDDDDKEEGVVIVAGVAFEYYKPSRVGLVSYLCVETSYRRRGLIRLLHSVALSCLGNMHDDIVYSTNQSTNHSDSGTNGNGRGDGGSGTNGNGPIRAILAETNTLTAGDATPELIAQRHSILHRLGYRQLQVPYVQPPLGVDKESFDDILLLVHCGQQDDTTTNDTSGGATTTTSSSSTTTLDSRIVGDFVTDFYQSVYCHEEASSSPPVYHQHWYYRLLSWFCQRHAHVPIVSTTKEGLLSWTHDCTDDCRRQWQQETRNIGIVGAGIAGLVTCVTLAKHFLRLKQPCTITIWEAQEYVGGRIRTILSTDQYNSNNQDNAKYMYIQDETLLEQCRAFAPWPIALGAEFLHGINSVLNTLVSEQGWMVEETFDLSPDEQEDKQNAFLTRPQTKRLSQEQRDSGPVRIFYQDQLFPYGDNHHHHDTVSTTTTDNVEFPKLMERARQLWNDVCAIADTYKSDKKNNNTNNEIPPDMSLEAFVRQRLTNDDSSSTVNESQIDVILQILETLYANTAASSKESYGIHEASREEGEWDYTECNFRTAFVFADLVKHYLNEMDRINTQGQGLVVISLQTLTPVVRIGDKVPSGDDDYDDDDDDETRLVEVTTADGTTSICDKLVVAVPLAVLKADMIAFEGACALSHAKRTAIQSVNMFSGMKIHVLLKCGVDVPLEMPKVLQQTEFVFCPGEHCVQLWFRRNEDSVLVTGFLPANVRDCLQTAIVVNESSSSSSSRSNGVKAMILDQLSRMYSTDNLFGEGKAPSCSAFWLYDWSDDPYVRGLYSSPSVGAGWKQPNSSHLTSRHDLACPIADTIFFAGEHTHTSTSATVQAAMESGCRVAEEVQKSLFLSS